MRYIHPNGESSCVHSAIAMEKLLARFPAFRNSDYRRLFVAVSLSSGSVWALILGRSWLVYELTNSAFAVGAVTFAGFIPFVVVGPFAGVVADRVDRRRMLMMTSVIGMATVSILVAVTVTNVVELWHVILLAFIQGSGHAASVPSSQALLANIVRKQDLLNAVSVMSVAQHGSRITGPLFGTALLTALGVSAVFMLAVLMIGLSLLATWTIRFRASRLTTPTPPTESPSALQQLRDGLNYTRNERRLATVLVLVGFHCGLTMSFDSMMPTLATSIGGDSGTYGAIMIALGVGAIIGVLSLSILKQPRIQGFAFLVAGLGSGLSMLAFGLATTSTTAVICALFTGGTQGSYMALSQVFIQEIVPDSYRGRALSFFALVAAGVMAFAFLGYGWLSEIIGIRPLLIFPGLLWVILFLLAGARIDHVRHLLRVGSFGTPQTQTGTVPPTET